MKKAITTLLAAALLLSLVACGGGNGNTNTPTGGGNDTPTTTTPSEPTTTPEPTPLSKDEMLAIAEEISSLGDLTSELNGNKAKAASYVGKTIKIKATIWQIDTEYIAMSTNTNILVLRVYLPLDELANLKTMTNITIVGEVTESYDENGVIHLNIKNAYITD